MKEEDTAEEALARGVVLVGGRSARRGARHVDAQHAAPKLTKVTLQLKWVTQAQFAGYYAAVDEGLLQEARAST